jgi:hypothetical protein
MFTRSSLALFLSIHLINEADVVWSIRDLCSISTDRAQNNTVCSASFNGIWSLQLKHSGNIYSQSLGFVLSDHLPHENSSSDLGSYSISIKSEGKTVAECNGVIIPRLFVFSDHSRQSSASNNPIQTAVNKTISCRYLLKWCLTEIACL